VAAFEDGLRKHADRLGEARRLVDERGRAHRAVSIAVGPALRRRIATGDVQRPYFSSRSEIRFLAPRGGDVSRGLALGQPSS